MRAAMPRCRAQRGLARHRPDLGSPPVQLGGVALAATARWHRYGGGPPRPGSPRWGSWVGENARPDLPQRGRTPRPPGSAHSATARPARARLSSRPATLSGSTMPPASTTTPAQRDETDLADTRGGELAGVDFRQ